MIEINIIHNTITILLDVKFNVLIRNIFDLNCDFYHLSKIL